VGKGHKEMCVRLRTNREASKDCIKKKESDERKNTTGPTRFIQREGAWRTKYLKSRNQWGPFKRDHKKRANQTEGRTKENIQRNPARGRGQKGMFEGRER